MRALLCFALAACSFSPQAISASSDAAGDSLGIDTVPIDAPVDMAIDARLFDPATDCPNNYNLVIAGLTSHYRSITNDADWPSHHADCADDLAGATHLIVFDSPNELALLGQQAAFRYLVGYFQVTNQAAVDVGWLTVTGGTVPSSVWLAGQPNDNDGVEDGEQDRGFINFQTGPGIQDGPSNFATNAMCECDGKPIPPAIAAML